MSLHQCFLEFSPPPKKKKWARCTSIQALPKKLATLMNAAARLIFSRFDHITPLLWLKASERIAIKCALIVYKCLHGSAPSYLVDELCQVADVEARQRLRSASSSSLIVGCTRLYPPSSSLLTSCRCSYGRIRLRPRSTTSCTSAQSMLVFRSCPKNCLFAVSYPSHLYRLQCSRIDSLSCWSL